MSGSIVGLAFKWLIVGGLVLYTGFGVILVVQAKIMGEAFDSDATPIVMLAALVHVVLAAMMTLVAVLIL